MSKGQPLYEPTDRLLALRAADPATAAQVEGLCRALLATRGLLIVYEQNDVLGYAMRQLEPWVAMTAPMLVEERKERMFERRRAEMISGLSEARRD
jgi:hypothetical protein